MPNSMLHEAERTRGPGVILVGTTVAIIALFLAHPAEHAADFAGFLQEGAANQIMNTVVHGGFVVILGVQLACYAIFSFRLGLRHPLVMAGLVFFAIGAMAHMVSIITDGVLTPALAARYVAGPPDRIAASRSLFVLCDVAVTWFGHVGLLFEAAGLAAWGVALFRVSRAMGTSTLLAGLAIIGAFVAALAIAPQFRLLAIAGLCLWALIAGTSMIRRIV